MSACVCVLSDLVDKTAADMERYTKLLDEKLLTLDLREGLVDKADEEKRRWVVWRWGDGGWHGFASYQQSFAR